MKAAIETTIIVKIRYLSEDFGTDNREFQVLAFGYGKNSRSLPTLMMRITDSEELPPAVFTGHRKLWFRYSDRHSVSAHLFDIELVASTMPSKYI